MPVTENPDFFVAYAATDDIDAFKKKVDKAGKETIDKAPESAILLILFDADTGAIIWLTQAEGEVKGLPADQVKKHLRYTVKKMFSGTQNLSVSNLLVLQCYYQKKTRKRK